MAEQGRPSRIVHLQGGLRAVDDRSGHISLQISADMPLARLSAPEYAKLYSTLNRSGLTSIGTEFVNADSYRGFSAPDWECSSTRGGFLQRLERNEWTNVRFSANEDGNIDVADAAARSKTYLQLLSTRILQLSAAYNQMLRSWHAGGGAAGNLFSNTFQTMVDAAVHAFLSDAGSYRDFIAELTWRFILKSSGEVTTLATFIKKAKNSLNPIAQQLLEGAEPGGWLKQLSDLRNEVIHVAPMGRGSAFHSCQTRQHELSGGVIAPHLHYPILASDGSVWRGGPTKVDFRSEESIIKGHQEYAAHVGTSIDGLQYAWETFDHLLAIHSEIRVATAFRSSPLHITDKDIIGPIRIIRRHK